MRDMREFKKKGCIGWIRLVHPLKIPFLKLWETWENLKKKGCIGWIRLVHSLKISF
jgi:hypothetical protein